MSMHLLDASDGATRMADRAPSLITSYENGSVKLWRYRNIGKERSIEGLGWECLWSFKLHVESGKRSVICRACWMLLSTHIFAQPRRQSWQQRFHSTVLSPSRCQQTTLLEDTISTKYVLDSHLISTAIKKGNQINALQADLISNSETIGTVFRTKHPGNGAVAFHDDGRVCAIGGWDGRCVPH